MFTFSKDTKDRIDKLLQSMTLSEAERFIVISQLEAMIARDIAKLLVSYNGTIAK